MSNEFPVETDLGGDIQFLLPLRKIQWLRRTKENQQTRGDLEDLEFVRSEETDMGTYEVFFWRMQEEQHHMLNTGVKTRAWYVMRTSCTLNPNLVNVSIADVLIDEDGTRYFVKDVKKSCREFNMITVHCEEED